MKYKFEEGKSHEDVEGIINGSWGEMYYVESITGEVIGIGYESDEDLEEGEYHKIVRFDFDEYVEHYKLDKANWEDWSVLDILDVACWFEDGTYHEAEESFRRDIDPDRSLRKSELEALQDEAVTNWLKLKTPEIVGMDLADIELKILAKVKMIYTKMPVKEIDMGIGKNVEQCEKDDPELKMWGVYVRTETGGVSSTCKWVADCTTEEIADTLIKALEEASNGQE